LAEGTKVAEKCAELGQNKRCWDLARIAKALPQRQGCRCCGHAGECLDKAPILETQEKIRNSVVKRHEVENSFKVDFIGIGAPKCGSTWLFYALGQHPKICLSEPKEITYFNREDFAKSRIQDKNSRPFINPNYTNNIAWYAKHYKHCPINTLKGEFSPGYLFDECAPSKIHQNFPSVKLLACLRNPIDRAHTTYWAQALYFKNEKHETFEEAIEHDPQYLSRGYYARNLKRYLTHFGKEQLKIVLLEDIIERPEQTIREVFDFLDVDPKVEIDLKKIPKNSAKKSHLLSPEPLMRWVSSFLIDHDQAVLLHKIRNLGLKKILLNISTVDYPREPMNPETRDRLRRLFREDISELETLLDRDLTAWR
jgi:hypothetical protein